MLFNLSGTTVADLKLFVSHCDHHGENSPVLQFTAVRCTATAKAGGRNVLIVPFPQPSDELMRLVRVGNVDRYRELFVSLDEMFEVSSDPAAVSDVASTSTVRKMAKCVGYTVCKDLNRLCNSSTDFELSATLRPLLEVRPALSSH
jgi:hypothetical protein